MPPKSDARERMLQSGAELFRTKGLQGTAFADVLEHSGAPRGSIYHHFPGGKDQFAEEVTQTVGDFIAASLAAILADHEPVEALELFAGVWGQILIDTDFTAGCALVAATVDGERSPGARDIAGAAFDRWEVLLAESATRRGVPAERARGFATLAVAAIEGAVVLSRAALSLDPFDRVVRELGFTATALLAGFAEGSPSGAPPGAQALPAA